MDKRSLLSGAWTPITKRLPSGEDRRIVVWNFALSAPATTTVRVLLAQIEQMREDLISPEKVRALAKVVPEVSYFTSHWIDMPKPLFDEKTAAWVKKVAERYKVSNAPF